MGISQRALLPFVLILLSLFGCGDDQGMSQSFTTQNPRPADFLDQEDADIFVLNSIVYSNAEGLEWVSEKEYTLGEKVGEITEQAKKAEEFGHGTASQLPVGTSIFKTNTVIYIAVVNQREIRYTQMIEG